ncbi:hypothetical protein Pcinc_025966 [Petrolisthes cinctipes]|uniref:Uncharacterized protein n=1 Tax=Petrolisthes cinctipes TaxID=88211 RepID=A0AAE1F7T5_PETCI|nr:hypothetical protein Pcinc_025966 [Petrolisthes cinctipes]
MGINDPLEIRSATYLNPSQSWKPQGNRRRKPTFLKVVLESEELKWKVLRKHKEGSGNPAAAKDELQILPDRNFKERQEYVKLIKERDERNKNVKETNKGKKWIVTRGRPKQITTSEYDMAKRQQGENSKLHATLERNTNSQEENAVSIEVEQNED